MKRKLLLYLVRCDGSVVFQEGAAIRTIKERLIEHAPQDEGIAPFL